MQTNLTPVDELVILNPDFALEALKGAKDCEIDSSIFGK